VLIIGATIPAAPASSMRETMAKSPTGTRTRVDFPARATSVIAAQQDR
jgi:hypothetical protein